GGMAVNRWRADATRDDTGQWIYLSDVTTGHAWSATHQPTAVLADTYDVTFATDRAVFRRKDGDIETQLEIAVLPRDRAEVRVVTVTNRSDMPRDVDVTSYAEVVLTDPDADRAHPAFQNLFIETEWVDANAALLASRRPRSAKETRKWCAHVVATGPERIGELSYETDRAKFVGRGRSTRSPRAADLGATLSGTVGATLDPIVSIRARVRVEPGRSAKVAFTTLVGETRNETLDCAGRYGDLHASERAISLAGTEAQVELRDRDITPAQATLFQELAAALIYPNEELRASAYERAENRRGQPALWAHGISGDWPIVVATIDDEAGLDTLRHLLTAHEYWRTKGITADLVILDTKAASYRQDFQDQLHSIVIASTEGFGLDKPGGVFIRRTDVISDEDIRMLRATARVQIVCDGADLSLRAPSLSLSDERAVSEAPGRLITPAARPSAGSVARSTAPNHENGYGGLTSDGAYEIRVSGGCVPPAPWINVIANPNAGFCITERGGGFTWVESSYFYRLTPWHNDPVSDQLGEVLYLQDDEDTKRHRHWTPTPGPSDSIGDSDHEYIVRHAPGTTTFSHERDGITTELAVGVPVSDAVKISRLRITNTSGRPRRLTLTSYVELTLGAQREHTRHQIFSRRDGATGAVFASNFFADDFASRVAFSSISEQVTSYTADREEFLGRNGDLCCPAALERPRLLGATGAGIDPCAALQCSISLAPGESRDVIVLLGAGGGDDDARSLIARYGTAEQANAALDESVGAWERRLSTIVVRTPAPEFDAMANRWSLYQALSCRMWARSALYQSSGAFGFRDQLQDCMAFVYAEPGVARAHLLRSAARQFTEGDVQHWWHEPSGRGIRTRFSDDLVWLPFTVDHYVRVTGDTGVWDEQIPFLDQRPLEPGEHDSYEKPAVTAETATLYAHCLRALDRACTTGAHGLPLIGGGDWNDGMDRVGIEGKGESVWLGWFLVATLRRTADHAAARAQDDVAARLRQRADTYTIAIERDGWDGAWYRRAFFDDGTPLGSSANEECQIDAIAQSWSVMSGAGAPDRMRRAMQSLGERLVDGDARLIKLLTPPFDHMTHDPGYIKGYVPGVRENGAQYTHAAEWTAMATALLGDGDRAFEFFEMLNPLTHSRSSADVERYKVEPYAVCADIYTAAGHVGRGGWTWYTGSASWNYRVAIETILGFTKRGNALTIEPCVPATWSEFGLDYRFGNTMYAIEIRNPAGISGGVSRVEVDGAVVPAHTIPLRDDGVRHQVVVTMGR
ncbi:MAG: glycosyl transferase family 36, partial [Gemmatimonadaceae bacterium]